VERLVEAGANVLVADLDAELAAKKVAGLSGPGKATSIAIDVSNLAAGQRLVDECVSVFGTVDILVNNAGIYPMTPMLQTDAAMWNKVIAVNLTGLAFVSKAVGSHMVEQGTGGKIINIASIDALHPSMVGFQKAGCSCSPRRSPWRWHRTESASTPSLPVGSPPKGLPRPCRAAG
jgi:NAD(P)-dependent dehydrogenase (short-subunit alcohol dehydrogenase family)